MRQIEWTIYAVGCGIIANEPCPLRSTAPSTADEGLNAVSVDGIRLRAFAARPGSATLTYFNFEKRRKYGRYETGQSSSVAKATGDLILSDCLILYGLAMARSI